jgi:AcrR family transcriptional regulator
MGTAAVARTANRFERRRERSRAALIDAAIELFQERGVRETKLEEICERADVAPRTFFNHFETREHLYEAIARQRAVQFAEQLDALCADRRPLARRLNELFAAVGAHLSARPPYRELVAEMLRLRHQGGSEFTRSGILGKAVLRFVRDGVARGEIGRRHRPEVLCDLLLGALTVAIGNWSADSGFDLEQDLAHAAKALLDLFSSGRR